MKVDFMENIKRIDHFNKNLIVRCTYTEMLIQVLITNQITVTCSIYRDVLKTVYN